LEKEKKKSKTHGFDDFKENKLTLSKKKKKREKRKMKEKNMHHAFMLPCI